MYSSKTINQKLVKHENGSLNSIVEYANEQAYMFGYCDIYKNNEIVMTAHRINDKVKLVNF